MIALFALAATLATAQCAASDTCNTPETYTNPVLHADYSDPDVIRCGDDYWMVASSFTAMPGIPVLHSRNLVEWELAGHVYDSLPFAAYNRPQHGEGSWAPAIREHDGRFYVYFCTPSEGLFVAVAPHPTGPWKLTQMVEAAKWEDPCPFWDTDGQAYLVRSNHRGGPAILHRMSADGLRLLDDGVTVYHDPKENPVLEGMKIRKRDGWYYILCPAGGVSNGWQTVLRSRNIYGPYEARRVLQAGGDSGINGPHQGGLVDTPDGSEWWFVHFQSKGIHGRIINLEPVRWSQDGWPEMGNGGHPVRTWARPAISGGRELRVATSDEFTDTVPGLQWQWQANPRPEWFSLTANPGRLTLNAAQCVTEGGNLYYAPSLLLQKLPAENFTATTLVEPQFADSLACAGLVVFGQEYSYIALENGRIVVRKGKGDKRFPAPVHTVESVPAPEGSVYLRMELVSGRGTEPASDVLPPESRGVCRFSYSTDGIEFTPAGTEFAVTPGVWVGAKTGLFCITPSVVPSASRAVFDFFRVETR